ncbi:hypothetical protein GH733_014734 [Mirounga leonina]|nr:hypothetical protein GH733_014734 [Mirounga leonina]
MWMTLRNFCYLSKNWATSGAWRRDAIDKKCPFPSNVSIQGQILSGMVTKVKVHRTIVICQDYLHYIRKYNCFEKCHKNISMHLPPCFRGVNIGNIVTVGKCQPL